MAFYDYSKLSREVSKFGGVPKLAQALNLDVRVVADRLSNVKPFKQNEIEKITEILNIPRDEIMDYFFCLV